MAGKLFLCGAAAEFPEDEGADGEVEERAGEEAEENHDGDGMEDFATGDWLSSDGQVISRAP